MENFKSNLEKLQTKKRELQELKSEVEGKRNAFEQKILDQRLLLDEELLPLDQSIDTLSQECDELGSETVSVCLGDLINELSRLVGIPSGQMPVTLMYNTNDDKTKKDEPVIKINTLNMDRDSDPSIKSPILLKIRLDKASYPVLEQSFTYYVVIASTSKNFQKVLFEKCVEDIICTFTLEDLTKDDLVTSYPIGILRTAALNCSIKEVKVKTLGK